ncbi:hypothetical protein COSO111634_38395 [Corallococcus soli]
MTTTPGARSTSRSSAAREATVPVGLLGVQT